MSGIEYPAPREDVPIFDPLLFLEQDLGPLTEAIADTKYLRFPFAQGTENLATMNVNGLATFFDALTHQGAGGENFTTNQNIIMNGTVGKFIQFPDGSQQTTASGGIPPLVPDPTGTYTNATVQVNNKGQVITASNGTGIPPLVPDPTGTYTNATIQVNNKGQVIIASSGSSIGGYVAPPVFISSSTMTPMTQYNLDIPAGTRQSVFTVVGGGGAKGVDVLVGDTMYAGGMGGSGAYGRVSITATDDALIGFPAFQYQFVPNTTNPTTTGGGMNLMWSASALALYGQPIVGNNGGRIMSVSGGVGGTNAVAGTAGTGGLGGVAIVGGTGSFTIQSISGSAGNSPPAGGFTYSTAGPNNSYRGGQNANADIMLDGAIVSSACDGGSANYVNGVTFPYAGLQDGSVGGIYIEYFY